MFTQNSKLTSAGATDKSSYEALQPPNQSITRGPREKQETPTNKLSCFVLKQRMKSMATVPADFGPLNCSHNLTLSLLDQSVTLNPCVIIFPGQICCRDKTDKLDLQNIVDENTGETTMLSEFSLFHLVLVNIQKCKTKCLIQKSP